MKKMQMFTAMVGFGFGALALRAAPPPVISATPPYHIQLPTVTYNFPTPSDDRWHYPFGFDGATRPIASIFAAPGHCYDGFNDRDGQIIVAWDTSDLIAPGQGLNHYNIQSITLTMTHPADACWQPDLTTDPYYQFDIDGDCEVNADGIPRGEPGDVDGESDNTDPGDVLGVFGAGFGPYTEYETWTEFTPYEGSAFVENLPRDPYPFVYQFGTWTPLHAEDSIKGLWNADAGVSEYTATPWGIGQPLNYTPGEQDVPFDVRFTINLSESSGQVRRYFQEQLNNGRVVLIINTLTFADQQTPACAFAKFFMKEAVGVYEGAKAPKLTIKLKKLYKVYPWSDVRPIPNISVYPVEDRPCITPECE